MYLVLVAQNLQNVKTCCLDYLRYSVWCWIHELGEVHHALPLVLGHVNALNWGKAWVSVPEVLQLEFPLSQTRPCQLHKYLQDQQCHLD